jgi:hypothetical protein
MKSTLLFCAVLLTLPVGAATHAVLPGTSIQAKINLAAPGDIVAIFGGTYNEDLTVNKAIRLVEVSGQEVTITGSITWTGVVDAPPFEGFVAGSPGKGISVANTTGLIFRNLDARPGTGVSSSGATTTLKIIDSQLSNLSSDGGTVEISRSTVTDGITQTAGILHTSGVTVRFFYTQANAQRTVAYRTTVTEDVGWRSNCAWFGYSKARSFQFYGNGAKVVVVGSEIDRQGAEACAVRLHSTGTQYLISNCNIHNLRWRSTPTEEYGIWLVGGGNSAVIQNNSIRMINNGNPSTLDDSDGIRIQDTTAVKIRNNILFGCMYEINAPFGVVAQNNLEWSNTSHWKGYQVRGGISSESNLEADPLFAAGLEPKLQPTSPCINAGTPDARYNDRDGSRNDIGPSGGAWFDPDGWTTENPVVISFDLSPDQVLEGVEPEVILSEGMAVSAP